MSTLETLKDAMPGDRKYITFKLGGHLFALPSQKVLKIMLTPSTEQGGMVEMGLVQLAQYSIQLLELQTLLKLEQKDSEKGTNQESAAEKKSTIESVPTNSSTFLIILQAEQELWGIVVEKSPDLRTISDHKLKPVHTSKRLSGALSGISHIVTYEQVADGQSTESKTQSDRISHQKDRQVLLVLDLLKLLALSKVQTLALA